MTFGTIRRMQRKTRIAVAAERSSAYGRNFIQGVAEVAERHTDWALTLIDPNSVIGKIAEGYDGWICRIADSRTAGVLAACGKPVVDSLCEHDNPRFATVRGDAEAIGRLAAEHLMKHQFVNIAFCGYRHVAFSDRRRNAFASFLESKGLRPAIYRPPLRPENRFGKDFLLGDRVESPPDAVDLANWLKRLPKPAGIFCCDDLRASQVLDVCRTLKLAVPADVAILGVDDDPVYCMFSTPRLSSIDPDSITIGKLAATTLDTMFTDAAVARNPPSLMVKPKGVVERASTETYPGAPTWFVEALAYIRTHATKRISAADVFRHVGFSRTLVERAFRERLSATVQGLIAETRLETARRLLSTTVLPIKEVALLSGFATLEYFSRTFTATTGTAPSAWREREQNIHEPAPHRSP